MHTSVNLVFSDNEMLTRASSILTILGFESSCEANKTSVRMQHQGLNIDLHENRAINGIRKLISSKSDTVKLTSLDFYPGLVNPVLGESSMGIMESLYILLNAKKAQQDFAVVSHPYCNETAPRFSSKGHREDALALVGPKELVIPTLSSQGDTTGVVLSQFADVGVVPMPGNRPGLYCSSSPEDKLVLRLFPCRALGIVLRVEWLDAAEKFLLSKDIRFERLGNAISGRELQVVDSALTQAIDLRLSDNPEIYSFWREGVDGVIDHTTASMQNSRVFAGEDAGKTASSAQIDARTLNGDCWMEVRAQASAKIARHGGDYGGSRTQKQEKR